MSLTLSDAAYHAEFERWRDEAKAADPVAYVTGLGYRLMRQGAEWIGPCPRCGGRDRFSINPRRGVFNCRGFGGGDIIDMVMHIEDCDLLAACEKLTGRPPPQRTQKSAAPRQAPPPPPEPSAPPPPDDRRGHDDDDAGRRRRARIAAEELFDSALPIMGTHAAAYLEARGLSVYPRWTADLRFVPELPYWGYADADATEQVELGVYPAMVAAIRNLRGEIIAAHRTYLDPKEPRKLTPPGDRDRNAAKKVLGKMGGGIIRLSPPGPVLALGEGIETAQSFYMLGMGGDDLAVAAAVSLGNLAGGATGTKPHPHIAKRSIPNGEPDPDRPGLRLPPEVEEVIILGDGDSDPATTYATLLVAGRRFRADGREVFVAMAPAGKDWNDVLREMSAQQGTAI